MSQGPSQVDDYTDSYEVNADDFDEQRVAAEANGSDDCCIVLSDEESQGIAVIEHVVDNVVDNGGVTCEEVTETAAKNDDEDDSEDEVEDEQAELERAKVEPGFFADELELLDLTLPHPTFIRDKAVKKWNSRKLIVYPVTEDELETPQMIGLLKDPHCTQVTIHLDREKPSVESRMNFLDLVFDSKEETLKATEELKSINSSFNVLNATDVGDWNKDFDKSRSVHFSDYETKKWPSCLVCVKYLPRNITEEKLREIFPDAFEVLIYTNDRPNLTDAQRYTSFLFYRTPEEARTVVETNNEKKTSVDDVHLAFLKYDQSTRPQLISPSLLAMSERYLILKEKRMVEKLEKISGGNCAAALEKFNIKLKEDEMVRKTYSLPTPTVEEMRVMPNLKILKGIEALKIIKQKGLLWRNREKLLSADSTSLETPVHPENKDLQSGVTNPNKRKRKKITLETKTVPFAAPIPTAAGPPSLLQTAVDPAARPPQRKVMRLVQETDFTTFNEDDVFATAATEYGMMYPAPPPPPRRLRPHMERPPMMRPPMMPRGMPPRGIPPRRGMPPRGIPPRRGMPPRGMAPRGMPPGLSMARLTVSRPSSMMTRPAALGAQQQRPAGGYPLQPRITNQLSSRLMRLAHGDPVSSGTSVSTVTSSAPPRQLMTRPSTSLSSAAPRQLMAQMARPRSAGFGGRGPLAVPMRRPMMPGQRFPGPGAMLIRRGGPRPPGRAGWAVRH